MGASGDGGDGGNGGSQADALGGAIYNAGTLNVYTATFYLAHVNDPTNPPGPPGTGLGGGGGGRGGRAVDGTDVSGAGGDGGDGGDAAFASIAGPVDYKGCADFDGDTVTPGSAGGGNLGGDGPGNSDPNPAQTGSDGTAGTAGPLDPSGFKPLPCELSHIPQCKDGLDNDLDSRRDLDDPGCAFADDDSEAPDLPDGDGDGVPNVRDNCPLAANPLQVDSDRDGKGNKCDPDDDNDGLSDADELKLETNRLDKDSDDDGLGDYREARVAHTDPKKFDTDGDAISDGVELGVTNPIADPPGPVVGTNLTKFRKDLAPKTKTNPLKKDTDGDGLPDGIEDKNHNGRRDAGETSPLKKDTDGDGFNDKVDKKPLDPAHH